MRSEVGCVILFYPKVYYNIMRIVDFNRTNTTICPGSCVSVVSVDDGEEPGMNKVIITNRLRDDVDSLDGVVITSPDGDPASIPNLHKLIVSIKEPKLRCILMTNGGHPDMIDDLVGAGYVDMINMCVDGPLSPEQEKCLDIVRRYNYEFMMTVHMQAGIIGTTEIRQIAEQSKGCRHFIMCPVPHKAKDRTSPAVAGYKKKELESLVDAVKGIVRNPMLKI